MNALNSFINSFSTLIITVGKNKLSAVLTAVLLFLLVGGWVGKDLILEWIRSAPSDSVITMPNTTPAHVKNKVETILGRQLISINADRIIIHEFNHKDKTVSTKYAISMPGVSITKNVYATHPRSYINELIKKMWANPRQPICVKVGINEIKHPEFKDMLYKSGVKLIYACPISDITNNPIGILKAGYLTENKIKPDDAVIFNELTNTALRISGYILTDENDSQGMFVDIDALGFD